MLRKLIYPHSFIVTILTFVVIWSLDLMRLNLHFLDPFNQGLKDYEVTDIVYSKLRDTTIELDKRIILVNTGKPNRDTLSQVLNRIIAAKPKVIGIDMLMESRKNPSADSAFQKSLESFDPIVLGTSLRGPDKKTGLFDVIGCDTFFCDHVANVGFTNFPINDTKTVRIFSPQVQTPQGVTNAFAVRIAQLYNPKLADKFFERKNDAEEIFYSSDIDNFIQFEPENILDTTLDLGPIFADKIVLLGFYGSYEWDKPLLDKHYTPLNSRYTGRNTPDMYGVVIHANIIQMILDQTYVREFSHWVNLLLTFIYCYFNIHLFYKIYRRVNVSYHFLTRFLQIAEILALFFLVALAFHFYRFKIEFGLGITALLLTFDMIKFYENIIRPRVPWLKNLPEYLPEKVRAPKKTTKK